MTELSIRRAEERDLQRLTEIYNEQVVDGVSTLDLSPRTAEDRRTWLHVHNTGNHPLVVCTDGGDAVLGYASLSPYREKEAFCTTVELSIYVAPEARRRGVATYLMQYLLDWAADDPETHHVVSVVTGGNEASCRLHEKFGFTCIGVQHEVAMKFGRWLDIIYYEKLV